MRKVHRKSLLRSILFSSVGETGWKLVYAADYDEVNAEPMNITFVIIAVGIATMIISSIFFNIKFTRRLKPLQNVVVAADEMSAVMAEVAGVSQQVAVLNTSICDSSHEIAGAIGRINENIEQISGIVQTGAVTAQQSADTAEKLSDQAHILKQLVDAFTLSR